MPAGTFFRKGAAKKDNGEPVRLTDLLIGSSIRMLGQEFYITDADEFTRRYVR
jgi:hypothetical protein